MDLNLLMDYVLPSDGVLYKHCNGGFAYYTNDKNFEDGVEYVYQKPSENFGQFMERLVQKLIEDEKNILNHPVTTDYAIWSNYKKDN